MRYKKIVPVIVEQREQSTREVCDACGLDTDYRNDSFGGRCDEVTIGARIGDVWPEGDSRTIYEVDICGRCFERKILPALAALGIVVRKRDENGAERVFETDGEP